MELGAGPKIGDAASLWNFTPSPGWTKEEVFALKLALEKFGIGKWVQISQSGVLPGKLIQQLNGQTQRLLGQQSLAGACCLRGCLSRAAPAHGTLTAQFVFWCSPPLLSAPQPSLACMSTWMPCGGTTRRSRGPALSAKAGSSSTPEVCTAHYGACLERGASQTGHLSVSLGRRHYGLQVEGSIAQGECGKVRPCV